jgi:hypothetical protein
MLIKQGDWSLRDKMRRWVRLPLEGKLAQMVCTFRGCLWVDGPKVAIEGQMIIQQHTCRRCLRSTTTYAIVSGDAKVVGLGP